MTPKNCHPGRGGSKDRSRRKAASILGNFLLLAAFRRPPPVPLIGILRAVAASPSEAPWLGMTKNQEAEASLKEFLAAGKLLRIEFHTVTNVHILQREHNHAGSCGRSGIDHHDFSDRAPGHIANLNPRPLGLGKHVALDGWRILLGVFGSRRL